MSAAMVRLAVAGTVLLLVAACSSGPAATSPAATSPPAATPSAPPGSAGPARVVDYRRTHPEWLTRQHVWGHVRYPVSPPVGGDHNPIWQSCVGDVYTAPVANEHAVHSLEHGAVWITYRPGLPADQVAALARRVADRPYLFLSPYPGLDRPISLQAWGYQVKVDSAADPAIDSFIRAYRVTAASEANATCASGFTETGPDAFLNPPPS